MIFTVTKKGAAITRTAIMLIIPRITRSDVFLKTIKVSSASTAESHWMIKPEFFNYLYFHKSSVMCYTV